MPDKLVIRTSDRIQFKKCRRAWDIGSKIRQNYEPIALRQPLDFGTAWHKAMETWFDPDTWDWRHDPTKREVLEQTTRLSFQASIEGAFVRYLEARGQDPDGMDEETRTMRQEWLDLGYGMLANFFLWEDSHLVDFYPTHTEAEFEVPVGLSTGYKLLVGAPVVYQGRIDLIIKDTDGRYWIWDHKTTARMEEDMTHLELDEQMKSYAWAITKQLGIPIAGVVYMEYFKGFPAPPKVLERPRMNRWLSTSKSQDTSYELMLVAIEEQGELVEDYEDYLNFLKHEGRTYFRRYVVRYNQHEMDNLGIQISDEAVDMLDDPKIYPNPSKFGCRWCDHRTLCLAMNDGSDTTWILQEQYQQRSQ